MRKIKSLKIIFISLVIFLLSVTFGAFAESKVKQEWVAVCDGPESGADYLSSLAVSKNGNTYVTGQYRPCFEACNVDRISKSLDYYEYQEALKIAKSFGLTRGLEN